MSEIYVHKTEWYPVYTLEELEEDDAFGRKILISKSTLDRWKRAFEAFGALQKEIRETVYRPFHQR